jgi:hypothetical protein
MNNIKAVGAVGKALRSAVGKTGVHHPFPVRSSSFMPSLARRLRSALRVYSSAYLIVRQPKIAISR